MPQPSTNNKDAHPLTEILRDGARRMLSEAIEVEVAAWIDAHAHLKDSSGRRQVVRNGHLPERTIQTGIGEIEVKQPRVQDRRPPEQREKFSPAVLPPYLRRTKSLEELIPWLYLKGVGTGDCSEALQAILGPDAPHLSATTITRLKAVWEQDHEAWSQRSLAGKHHVSVWADGVHFNIRLERGRQGILVLMGATADGKKGLIARADGSRESEQSWKELRLDVKARGLEIEPALAIGDGALGFWKAMRQVWDATREQRCWVHTIRAQSHFGWPGPRSHRRHAAERDHVMDLQRILPHDHALDQELQERLLLLETCLVQTAADPIAEPRQVRQHLPGVRRRPAQLLLLLPMRGKDEVSLTDPAATLVQFLQADDPGLVRVDQPTLLPIQPLELRLQLLVLVVMALASLGGQPGHVPELRQERLRVAQ